ncbi:MULTISPECIES: flagellar biosynthesis anti-sigma factor FlgM [Alteromonadaceae]|uniref:flagellar biosynthesis anti-sigma factor FlgM n=1 Tax=Alteromonadaceae TaxID=72275 RepID=UPI001C098492|nr:MULTISPECIES: flagellar biosynthesis anti-sigma factor FlgM [Aliiglaciecola]MBU2877961.1 flagellar biosynthesis anti-sigma factor FlgM [Aliiglaciecola lipolytica]MDO6709326.1 flagellar biosynthesis anti-sigma factor FlgM [Aliiglaciecola sp. 2_MG-2023]MDO6750474.1 flagellar biosynthesis anti-sigma factor FlgM [Aliiglaciecola sp. 1_MG-2023]
MAINNINSGNQKPQLENQRLNQQQSQSQATAQSAAQQSKSAEAPRQDSVSLTQSAQQLSQVQKKSSDTPVNQEKVDKLKKAIQNGEYRVNPEVLAQKISKLEAQVFGIED